MNVKEEDMPALQELEAAVVEVWERHPDLNDYAVERAYEAAFDRYRAHARARGPRPLTLTGLDLETYNAVRDTCEKLLSTGAAPMKGVHKGNTSPLPVEKLVEYLRELQRSVQRHTKAGGRQGYLEFIRDYMI